MDPVNNPYSPGAGVQPVALVGRDEPIYAWSVSLRRAESGRPAKSMVLYGLRGVGKTVLLTRLAREAEDRGWIVAQVEAGAGKTLRQALSVALRGPLASLDRPNIGARIMKALKTALSFQATVDATGSWTFSANLADSTGGGADTGNIEADLGLLIRDLGEVAAETSVGIVIAIDEAQDLSTDELVAVCASAHMASQQALPVLFVLAGLPSLPRVLAEAKSYSERLFDFVPIEHLASSQAAKAVTEPAAQEGIKWAEDAVSYIVGQTRGYPYFLQQFGQEAWNHAVDSITLVDAEIGAARGQAQLDTGFFRSRWDRATKSEQAYLREMARDGDTGSNTSDIAVRMNRKPTSLGPMRANLINKGLIYAPDHGVVAFTVPAMAEFINRQPSE
jgi:type II secretory pathway predicted ATPase ExeA